MVKLLIVAVGGINPEIGGKRSGVGGIPTIQLKEQPRMEERYRLAYRLFEKNIGRTGQIYKSVTLDSRFRPLIKKTKPSTFFIRK